MPQSAHIEPQNTHLFREAAEASAVVQRQRAANTERVAEAVQRLRQYQPRAVVTCARGSSDHAATYAKYLIETHLGLITASAAPSIGSVYRAEQQLDQTLFIAISQSGKSPDLLANVERAKAAGALTLALVNVADSPLAGLADLVLPLHAGDEVSVAATKSYIGSLAAIFQLVAAWSESAELHSALDTLPGALSQAWACDWHEAVNAFQPVNNMFVIGRGIGFGVAQEAALKLKETCGLHAEAFSAAEVRHGPMALVGKNFPVLAITQIDDTLADTQELVREFRQRGARVMMTGATGTDNLPIVADAHPAIAPILAVQSFYRMVNELAIARGYNPDEPPHLRKVTETT
ncbi:SIS domain-containing protein [Marinimicrobium sp. ABcell2]|uniref:SIS domain-containing protein n=1 Tax=Marinimicrobium sp. ABcell2 TaxID=3069751 RepID=UPI0027B26291|nr:SIS domain-containing protein [Marinimicrobium sp. ABcell2]MDQ2075920.1 SIS domain-containing protein [Marinimicrobium sp. ABcell2]